MHDPPSRLRCLSPALLFAGVLAAAACADGEEFRFGSYRMTIDGLGDPTAVVVDERERIYVLESARGCVAVYGPDGTRQGEIGAAGSGPGQLLRPQGLALADDRLYVADTGNHRVQVFGLDGAVHATWGRRGRGEGMFCAPGGVTVRGSAVYVADVGNDRVQVLDRATGAFRAAAGGPGQEPGRFNRPVAVCADDRGHVFVADADNNRIQELDSDLTFVRAWGDYGPFRGLMDDPRAIIHREGRLYVADTRNHRVQVFDDRGSLVREWGTHAVLPHEGEGVLHYPSALAIAPSGRFGVIVEEFENRAQLFDAATGDEAAPPPVPAARMRAHFGPDIAVDGVLMALTEPENHRLFVLETSKDIPIVIGETGERGRRFGQLLRVAGLAIDERRREIILGDAATARLQSFDIEYDPDEPRGFSPRRLRFATALELARLGPPAGGPETMWPIVPAALARGAEGRVLVADARNAQVWVIDEDEGVVGSFGGYGTAPGRLRWPSALAVSPSGDTIAVVDAGNHRVQLFGPDGTPRGALGALGDGEGRFRHPRGVAIDGRGFLYVTDSARHCVQKFAPDGAFVRAWGRLGVDHGQFWKPAGIAVDDRNRVIVVDEGNHRCQIFDPDGDWLVTFGTGRAYTKWDPSRMRQTED